MATNAKNLAELLNTDTTVKVGDIEDGSVTTAKLADGGVSTAKLAADAVTNAKIANDSINTENVNLSGFQSLGRRNLLDNGSFQIWQRGTGPFTVNNFGCDRWYGWGNQHNVTRQAATQLHGFAIRVAHNDSGSNTFSAIAQTCEYETAAFARGKKLTFSCRVRKGSAFTGTLQLQIVERTDTTGSINTGTRNVLASGDVAVTTSSTRFTITTTGTVSNSAQAIGVNVNHNGTSGTDANNFFEVEEAQLEIGEHATDFEYASIADNQYRCMRFFEKSGVVNRQPFNNQNGHIFGTPVDFKVVKRTTPTVTLSNGYTTDGMASYQIEGHGSGGYTNKTFGFSVQTTSSTTSNSLSMVQCDWQASSEL